MEHEENNGVRCPFCLSEAIYRYGKAWTGKQRFYCLVCQRQFTMPTKRRNVTNKPICPTCGSKMNIYRRLKAYIRFRCSKYPSCKTYQKIRIEEDSDELLHT